MSNISENLENLFIWLKAFAKKNMPLKWFQLVYPSSMRRWQLKISFSFNFMVYEMLLGLTDLNLNAEHIY